MKYKLLVGLVLGIFMTSMLISAQQVSNVRWQPSPFPFDTGVSGDTIKLTGKVRVESNSPVSWSGDLRFRIWGTAPLDQQCNVVCGGPGGVCYDWEACNGQNCGNVCLQGEWGTGTNTICGQYPGCLNTPACGFSCDNQYAGDTSGGCLINGQQDQDCQISISTLQPGQESNTIVFEKEIGNWPDGNYVAILHVIDDQNRDLDIEFVYFTVGPLPAVNVLILLFEIVLIGLGIFGLAYLAIRRFR